MAALAENSTQVMREMEETNNGTKKTRSPDLLFWTGQQWAGDPPNGYLAVPTTQRRTAGCSFPLTELVPLVPDEMQAALSSLSTIASWRKDRPSDFGILPVLPSDGVQQLCATPQFSSFVQ
ncbi:hypothetical protein Cni_G11598 [Canna indica]|uniref:Uncharacterized protein n=1 Tax=Canna indica TaxID=4628 RepID=A0AAQ3Q9P6_9LILI|nr:hypothetical protein Cni_G11598 [Canna indica]